jgi:hypothetical protein
MKKCISFTKEMARLVVEVFLLVHLVQTLWAFLTR